MFSLGHIIMLLIFLVLPIFFAVYLSKTKISVKNVMIICIVISAFSELFRGTYFINEVDGYFYLFPSTLPLHLCSIQIIFIFAIGLTKNEERRKKLIAFFIPTALWGGTLALVIPTTLMYHGLMHTLTFNFFIFHGLLIFLSIYLYIKEFKNLNIKSYIQCLSIISLLFLGSIYMNSILQWDNTNFFFTAAPPMEGLPLLNLNNGWITYIFTLVTLGVFLITITYIPVFLNIKNNKTSKINA